MDPKTDAECLDVNVDYGHGGGYFVRVDVELPKIGLYDSLRSDGGPMGYLSLGADEAVSFAAHLVEVAAKVRSETVKLKGGP